MSQTGMENHGKNTSQLQRPVSGRPRNLRVSMQYTFEDQYKIKAKSECEIMDIYAIAQREREEYRVWGRSELGGIALTCPLHLHSGISTICFILLISLNTSLVCNTFPDLPRQTFN